jgi:GxxExxY protein
MGENDPAWVQPGPPPEAIYAVDTKSTKNEMGLIRSEQVSPRVIGLAIEVHRQLGSGLLESAYEECLCVELAEDNIAYQPQVPIPIVYKGTRLDCGYRIDLLVAQCVVVEIKAIERLLPIHSAQILTYLRLSGHKIGLLMNFHATVLKDALRRFLL